MKGLSHIKKNGGGKFVTVVSVCHYTHALIHGKLKSLPWLVLVRLRLCHDVCSGPHSSVSAWWVSFIAGL